MQIQKVDKYEGYSESTEPIDAVNILPLANILGFTSYRSTNFIVKNLNGGKFVYLCPIYVTDDINYKLNQQGFAYPGPCWQ